MYEFFEISSSPLGRGCPAFAKASARQSRRTGEGKGVVKKEKLNE
jgi:hypothetical protein